MELRGVCVLLPTGTTLPPTLPDCPKRASDIVFLVDGSGSISAPDFERMKMFITQVMTQFQSTDTRFALVQFSSGSIIHFDFSTFAQLSPMERVREVQSIPQTKGTTATATAIRTILIVVTDGQKFGDSLEFGEVIPEAERAGVIRYAIGGEGTAFTDAEAVLELQAIASKPTQDHIFRVDNFDALQSIQSQLQEKIFAIEGTQSAQSSSFQLEMAQEGFSALLTPDGPILGAVGVYDWSGGVFVYGGSGEVTLVNVSQGSRDMNDAYLGYAAEPLWLGGSRALALGAPRFAHVGRLFLFHPPRGHWDLLAEAAGTQVGSYFGGSLCALDTDGDGAAEVLLVGAPTFYGAGGGGHVAICDLKPQGGRLPCQGTLRGQPGHPLGRFGASLAALGDLDGDRWGEGVGAPLEDEERGAVYIFRGTRGGVAPRYSQRISGAGFSSAPRHLGQALSGGRDLTGDLLPDVAMGAQGQVLLLRSRPLLKVRAAVAFQPQEIPAGTFECRAEEVVAQGEVARAEVCFLATKKTKDNFGSQVSTTLRYQVALDPGRAMVRAVFAGGAAVLNGTLGLGVGRRCQSFSIAFPGCPRDTLTPLVLRVSYEATGDPIEVAGGLQPDLSEDSAMVAMGTLPFEKNCGADHICTDDLQISFNFSGGLDTVVVGDTDAVDVTVTLHHGEDSYGATVQLQHHPALSYRKATVLQSSRSSVSLQCHSEPAVGRHRRTLCLVNHPILHPGTEVVFRVTLDVPQDAELGEALEVVANASSDNGAPGGRGHRAEVPVRYSVYVVLSSTSNSTAFVPVSPGPGVPDSVPVTHHYQVTLLGQRGPPLTVTLLVPSALGGAPLWDHLEVTRTR
ncbi:LOW QUALITY PROTEIN: integrin alpha-X-like [Aegotheles albertisi]